MIINKPHLCTTIEIWAPRYKDKSAEKKEWVVLIPHYKLESASPVFLMKFTKAKHLLGGRYCMKREQALGYPTETVKSKQGNDIPMHIIPLPDFEHWDSAAEVLDIANNLFPD